MHQYQVISSMVLLFEAVDRYMSSSPPAAGKVVLFMDIDNTILKMKDNLGSDQWFKWQLRLIQEASNSDARAARDLEHLQRICNVLYKVHPCEPCEPDVPAQLAALVAKWGPALRLVFITARAHIMYDTSVAQLKGLLGDAVDFDLITCNGGTKARYAQYYLDADPQTRAFFFVDDSHEHFAPFDAVPAFDAMHVGLYHYTQQLPVVAAFNAEDKARYVDMYGAVARTGAFDELDSC